MRHIQRVGHDLPQVDFYPEATEGDWRVPHAWKYSLSSVVDVQTQVMAQPLTPHWSPWEGTSVFPSSRCLNYKMISERHRALSSAQWGWAPKLPLVLQAGVIWVTFPCDERPLGVSEEKVEMPQCEPWHVEATAPRPWWAELIRKGGKQACVSLNFPISHLRPAQMI